MRDCALFGGFDNEFSREIDKEANCDSTGVAAQVWQHSSNPSSYKAETGGSQGSGQPGLHGKILCLNKQQKNTEEEFLFSVFNVEKQKREQSGSLQSMKLGKPQGCVTLQWVLPQRQEHLQKDVLTGRARTQSKAEGLKCRECV